MTKPTVILKVDTFERSPGSKVATVTFAFPDNKSGKFFSSPFSESDRSEIHEILVQNNIIAFASIFHLSCIFREFGIPSDQITVIGDPFVLSCTAQHPKHSLFDLVKDFDVMSSAKVSSLEKSVFIESVPSDLEDPEYKKHNVRMCSLVGRLEEKLVKAFPSTLSSYALDLQAIPVAAMLGAHPVRVSRADLVKKASNAVEWVTSSGESISEMIGTPFNPRSTKAVKEAFARRGIPNPPMRTPKGDVSFSRESILMLDSEDDLVTNLHAYYAASDESKDLAAALDRLSDEKIFPAPMVSGFDGSAQISDAGKGFSYSGKDTTRLFVPDEGKRVVRVSWTAPELSVLAFWGRERRLQQACQGGDPFSFIGQYMNVSISSHSVDTIITSMLNGSTGLTAMREDGILVSEARRLISQFWKTFTDCDAVRNRLITEAHRTGVTKSILGRIRRVKEIHSAATASKAERKVLQYVIGGSASELQRMLLVRLRDLLLKSSKSRLCWVSPGVILLQVPEDVSEAQITNLRSFVTKNSCFSVGGSTEQLSFHSTVELV